MHLCACVYVRACVLVCMCVRVCVYVCVCVHVHACMYLCVQVKYYLLNSIMTYLSAKNSAHTTSTLFLGTQAPAMDGT